MRIISIKLYKYEELDRKAQLKAKEWFIRKKLRPFWVAHVWEKYNKVYDIKLHSYKPFEAIGFDYKTSPEETAQRVLPFAEYNSPLYEAARKLLQTRKNTKDWYDLELDLWHEIVSTINLQVPIARIPEDFIIKSLKESEFEFLETGEPFDYAI